MLVFWNTQLETLSKLLYLWNCGLLYRTHVLCAIYTVNFINLWALANICHSAKWRITKSAQKYLSFVSHRHSIYITVCCIVTSCSLVVGYQGFKESHCFLLHNIIVFWRWSVVSQFKSLLPWRSQGSLYVSNRICDSVWHLTFTVCKLIWWNVLCR